MDKNFLCSSCHHMLFKELWETPASYVRSLGSYLEHPQVEYYEGWIPRDKPYCDEAIRIIKSSGKTTIYDIGPRPNLKDPDPSASHPEMVAYTLDFYKKELDLAFAIGAKKIVLDAGNDAPKNRDLAKKTSGEFLFNLGRSLPKDVIIVIENTDRTLQRKKLFGPTSEMMDFIKGLRSKGLDFLYPMVDMGHIPLYDETPAYALNIIAPLLKHVHLSNCFLKDPSHPLYGDRHVPYGYPGSEYDYSDLSSFMNKLNEIGYLKDGNTISFEVINLNGGSSIKRLDEWKALMDRALKQLFQDSK